MLWKSCPTHSMSKRVTGNRKNVMDSVFQNKSIYFSYMCTTSANMYSSSIFHVAERMETLLFQWSGFTRKGFYQWWLYDSSIVNVLLSSAAISSMQANASATFRGFCCFDCIIGCQSCDGSYGSQNLIGVGMLCIFWSFVEKTAVQVP